MPTIKTGWIKDNSGEKFAPKTFVSQIMTSDGINLESKIESMIAEKADADHGHNIADIPNLQNTLNEKANQTSLDSLSEDVGKKADSSALSSHTGNAEIHVTQDEKNTWSGKANATHSHAISDVTNLQSTLNGKASQSDLDSLSNVVDGKADEEHGHAISDITNLQTTLDGKQTTITGGASTIASSNLTKSRALISNSSGKVAASAVTSTELGYLDGVTSSIQSQFDNLNNNKADKTALNDYYTKTQIDSLNLIDVADIDAICGAQIVAASEVMF